MCPAVVEKISWTNTKHIILYRILHLFSFFMLHPEEFNIKSWTFFSYITLLNANNKNTEFEQTMKVRCTESFFIRLFLQIIRKRLIFRSTHNEKETKKNEQSQIRAQSQSCHNLADVLCVVFSQTRAQSLCNKFKSGGNQSNNKVIEPANRLLTLLT